MIKKILFIGLITSLFSSSLFAWDWAQKTQNKLINSNQKILEMKALYRLKREAAIKDLELKQKILENQIKMLNKTINSLTSSYSKDYKESTLNYSISPKIIIKTINYDYLIKKPIYEGMLLYMLNQKSVNQVSQNVGFSGFETR